MSNTLELMFVFSTTKKNKCWCDCLFIASAVTNNNKCWCGQFHIE